MVKLRVSLCWCSRSLALGSCALMGRQELQGLHYQHLQLSRLSPTSHAVIVHLSEGCSWQMAASPSGLCHFRFSVASSVWSCEGEKTPHFSSDESCPFFCLAPSPAPGRPSSMLWTGLPPADRWKMGLSVEEKWPRFSPTYHS